MNETELRSFCHFQILKKLYTQSLAEILKLTNLQVCLESLEICQSQSKLSKSNVNMIYKCYLDDWNRIKNFSHFRI